MIVMSRKEDLLKYALELGYVVLREAKGSHKRVKHSITGTIQTVPTGKRKSSSIKNIRHSLEKGAVNR